MNGDLQIAPSYYHELLRQTAPKPEYARNPLFSGPRITTNAMFPFVNTCPECNGTGVDPMDHADCRKCRATGGTKVIGMMEPMTIITGKLPRKFAPRFPMGLVALPMLSRGLA